jgi:transcriptional regulator with XRE-family HTH domain
MYAIIYLSGGDHVKDYAFGNFLAELRAEKGLSQSELGGMLGVTNKAVSKWENGTAKPNTKLIPELAKVLGVSVEELFAAKRIEKDDEAEKIKLFLCAQKKKIAVRFSLFLSILLTLPALLVEFICAVMIFSIPDDVIGPLGAMTFILLFVISLVSFIIYRSSFKRSFMPDVKLYSDKMPRVMQIILICAVIFIYFLLVLMTPLILLLVIFVRSKIVLIFIFTCAFLCISVFGVSAFILILKRALRIKFKEYPLDTKGKWRENPLWVRACVILLGLLLPIMIRFYIFSGYESGGAFISGFITCAFSASLIAVSAYNIYKSYKK